MKKHLITTSFIIFLLTASTPLGVEAVALNKTTAPIQAVSAPVATKTDITPTAQTPKSIPEKNAYELEHMEPHGFKYTAFRFFLAMFGVLISAIAIFLGLKFYKKIMLKNNAKLENMDYNKTLQSPKDFKEAINIFLDKTEE